MNFEFSEEQKSMIALTKDFCKREVDVKHLQELADRAAVAKNAQELRDNMPWDLVEKLHDVGLRQLCVPERYGGGAVDWVTRLLVAEEAGHSGTGLFSRLLTIPWKPCTEVGTLGSKELQDWFFPQFMESRKMFVSGSISEPEGMTDICLPYDEPGVALRTMAVKDGDEWVINGNKMFCSAGGVDSFIVTTVRTDKKGPLTKSASQFLISTDSPGIEFEVNHMIGGDISGNCQIHFTDFRVPEARLLGKLNQAGNILPTRLASKLIHFAGLVVWTQGLFEDMVDYAKQRVQGGKPIFQHINIGATLAEAAVNLEVTRGLMYRAAWEYRSDEAVMNPIWGIYVNYFFKKMALRLCELADEIYAGVGGTREMPLDGYVRYLFGMLHGGSTMNLNLIKAGKLL